MASGLRILVPVKRVIDYAVSFALHDLDWIMSSVLGSAQVRAHVFPNSRSIAETWLSSLYYPSS